MSVSGCGTLLEHMEQLAVELDCAIVYCQGMFHFIPNGEHPSDEMLAASIELARKTVEEAREAT